MNQLLCKPLFISIVLFYFLPMPGKAQTVQRIAIGFDPLKSALHAISEGYHFNPEIQYHFVKHFGMSVEGIFVNAQQSSKSRNIQNYQSLGNALKIGLLGRVQVYFDKDREMYISFGIKYLRTRFRERGIFEVPGPYFGSYREPFERESLRSTGLALELAYSVETFKKVWFKSGISFTRTLRDNWNTEDTPNDLRALGIRYAPGVGRIVFPSTETALGAFILHSKIFYQF